jgi:hypothetical protein
VVEGIRGDFLAWVRRDAEVRVERCHLRRCLLASIFAFMTLALVVPVVKQAP